MTAWATFCSVRKPVPRGLVGELYVGGVRKSTAGSTAVGGDVMQLQLEGNHQKDGFQSFSKKYSVKPGGGGSLKKYIFIIDFSL